MNLSAWDAKLPEILKQQ